MARPIKRAMNAAASAVLCIGCLALSFFVIAIDHDPFAWLGVLGALIWGGIFAVQTIRRLRASDQA
jgi:hypothetical protein